MIRVWRAGQWPADTDAAWCACGRDGCERTPVAAMWRGDACFYLCDRHYPRLVSFTLRGPWWA